MSIESQNADILLCKALEHQGNALHNIMEAIETLNAQMHVQAMDDNTAQYVCEHLKTAMELTTSAWESLESYKYFKRK